MGVVIVIVDYNIRLDIIRGGHFASNVFNVVPSIVRKPWREL